jgi:hypothetical protein
MNAMIFLLVRIIGIGVETADQLGPVYIHRIHSTLATRLMTAAKHLPVFS